MIDDENSPMHCMTLPEREQLKRFARRGEGLVGTLIAITHWMRCGQDISFSAYISNWAAAQEKSEDVEAIRAEWPLSNPRMIADGLTEWGSYLQGRGGLR